MSTSRLSRDASPTITDASSRLPSSPRAGEALDSPAATIAVSGERRSCETERSSAVFSCVALTQRLLGAPALGDVAQHACEERLAARAPARERELDGELGPVLAQAGKLDAPADDVCFARLEEALEARARGRGGSARA